MPASPVAKKERIEALDVLRGLALFGILVVNVEQMFLPLVIANDPVAMIPGEWGFLAVWAVTDALFESKFITLFSLLFGAGFALQAVRVEGDPRGFRRRHLRRLFVLALFGLIHAALFYKADVLVIYAITALVLLPLRRLSARSMGIAGGVLLTLTVAWGVLLSGPDDPATVERKQQVAHEIATIRESGMVALPKIQVTEPAERPALTEPDAEVALPLPLDERVAVLVLEGGDDFAAAKVDYAVFSQGPIGAATYSRLSFLALLLLIYTPVYLLWRTLALFLIGAAIVKAGWLDRTHAASWRTVATLGFGFGLPVTVAATALHLARFDGQGAIFYAISGAHDVAGLLLAPALGAATLLGCAGGAGRRVRRGLAAVGRTALSNYIGQSVVMSLVATSYGLGLFGDLTRLQILGLAIACFLAQVGASVLWLRRFRMGPLEWIWRCSTYWRALPLIADRKLVAAGGERARCVPTPRSET